MEDLIRRHFFFHGGQDPPPHHAKVPVNSEEALNCHWCQLRTFSTHATLPVSVVNDNDKAVLPPRFRFISASKLKEGVTRAEENFRSGCQCDEGGKDCMYGGCHCLQDLDSDDEDSGGDEDEDGSDIEQADVALDGTIRKKRFAYHSRGERAGLLRASHLRSRKPIYECHDWCRCGPNCPNRVVERGRTVPLQIFRTEDGRGWGVRSTIDIKRGQFVDLYIGEVITSREAERRRSAASSKKAKDVYLFALDKFSDEDSLDPRLAGPPLEVDGEYMSGPSRFVNHSCEPNMRIFARVGDHADKPIHDLALFSVRDIPKMEELTFDYVDGLETMRSDAQDPRVKESMTVCLCKSEHCRGYLW